MLASIAVVDICINRGFYLGVESADQIEIIVLAVTLRLF